MISVGIVGVGRIGSRFDEEPGRRVPWSHVGAYLAHGSAFRIAGVAEIDDGNRKAFAARCPGVPIFADAAELVRTVRPDVVSVCTPTARHVDDVRAAAAGGTKLIWCEKPLAASLEDGERLLDAASQGGAAIVVSYVRRWLPLWRRFREILLSGEIGRLISLRVVMPNRLFTIQSHAVDLALFLGGAPVGFGALPIPALAEEGEDAAVIAIDFASGAHGLVHPAGMRARLLIEAEAIGDAGRVRAAEHDGKIVIERFESSGRFAGYSELVPAQTEASKGFGGFSPFAAIAGDIARAFAEGSVAALGNGGDALAVQRILDGAQREPWRLRALA